MADGEKCLPDCSDGRFKERGICQGKILINRSVLTTEEVFVLVSSQQSQWWGGVEMFRDGKKCPCPPPRMNGIFSWPPMNMLNLVAAPHCVVVP